MPTAWSPAPYIQKENWVLADGTIVASPDFEATSSGRRVRVVGTTESVGNRQVDSLIAACIEKIAADKNTTRVARIFSPAEDDQAAASQASVAQDVFTQQLTLHMLDENYRQNSGGITTAVWKFEAENMPLHAYVFVRLVQSYNERWEVKPSIVWRVLPLNNQNQNCYGIWENESFQMPGFYHYSSASRATHEWLSEHPITPNDLKVKNKSFNSQMRSAIVQFAEWCKAFDDEVERLELPSLLGITENTTHDDVKKIADSTLITFKRVSSNYSASFLNELLAFVQTGPTLKRIQETYKSLMADLKQLGLVTTDLIGDSEFAQALNGDLASIRATVMPSEDNIVGRGDGRDEHHNVVLHLATGTLVVNCAHRQNQNEAAQAWEVAKFKAEMTGEIDELLEYARAYARPKEQLRIQKIIDQREIPNL